MLGGEGELMKKLWEDRHVRQQVRTVESRLDMNAINLEAERYAEAVVLGGRGQSSFLPKSGSGPRSRGRPEGSVEQLVTTPPVGAGPEVELPSRQPTPVPLPPDIDADSI